MLEHAKARLQDLQDHLQGEGIDIALLTHESTIAYYAGFCGYLPVEFGRPIFLIAPAVGDPIVVTPLMESEMVAAMTWLPDVRTWEGFGPDHWDNVLAEIFGTLPTNLGVEQTVLPGLVRNWLKSASNTMALADVSPLIAKMRAVKSPFEIGTMKQVGMVAAALMPWAQEPLAEYPRELVVIDR
jgi:Xaa-Pro aminopeptidase